MRTSSIPAPLLGLLVLAGGCDRYEWAPHLPFPQFPAGTAPVISPIHLVTIVSNTDPLAAKLLDASDAMMASRWLHDVGDEYGVGAGASTRVMTDPLPAGVTSDTAVAMFVQRAIDGGSAPAPDPKTLYLVYLPDGITLTWNGKVNTDCGYVRAYKFSFTMDSQIGVVQRCSKRNVDGSTLDGSRMMIGAATNPHGNGYHLDAMPAGDPWTHGVWLTGLAGAWLTTPCGGTWVRENGVLYTRVFSNRAAATGGDPCVPARDTPYVNASAAKEWYAVDARGNVDIPLTAWSDAPAPRWPVGASLGRNKAVHTWSIDGANVVGANGSVYQGSGGFLDAPTGPFAAYARNGETVTLQFRPFDGMAPGDWAVLTVSSSASAFDPAGAPKLALPPDPDNYHYSLVGVYAPW